MSVQEWTEDERQSGRGTRPSQGWRKMKHHSYVKKERQQEQKSTKLAMAVRGKIKVYDGTCREQERELE